MLYLASFCLRENKLLMPRDSQYINIAHDHGMKGISSCLIRCFTAFPWGHDAMLMFLSMVELMGIVLAVDAKCTYRVALALVSYQHI